MKVGKLVNPNGFYSLWSARHCRCSSSIDTNIRPSCWWEISFCSASRRCVTSLLLLDFALSPRLSGARRHHRRSGIRGKSVCIFSVSPAPCPDSWILRSHRCRCSEPGLQPFLSSWLSLEETMISSPWESLCLHHRHKDFLPSPSSLQLEWHLAQHHGSRQCDDDASMLISTNSCCCLELFMNRVCCVAWFLIGMVVRSYKENGRVGVHVSSLNFTGSRYQRSASNDIAAPHGLDACVKNTDKTFVQGKRWARQGCREETKCRNMKRMTSPTLTLPGEANNYIAPPKYFFSIQSCCVDTYSTSSSYSYQIGLSEAILHGYDDRSWCSFKREPHRWGMGAFHHDQHWKFKDWWEDHCYKRIGRDFVGICRSWSFPTQYWTP